MTDPILEIEHLSKAFRSHWTFRSHEAVTDLSLSVLPGESFGFLGHNGAGKTTTIKCIVGLVKKTSGKIIIDGKEERSNKWHQQIGYLPELPYFYEHLSVFETLDFFATLLNLRGPEKRKRIEMTLERVGLIGREKMSVRSLSKGLQQRLAFAQAILHSPRLLLLDEPFSGLDPIGRHEMKELLLELRKNGTTLFLSSHILSDVEEICDRVSIMKKGKLVSLFSIAEIPSLFGERFELTFYPSEITEARTQSLRGIADNLSYREDVTGKIVVLTFNSSRNAQTALRDLTQQGIQIRSFQSLGVKLEDIFLRVTTETQSSLPTNAVDKSTTQLSSQRGAEAEHP